MPDRVNLFERYDYPYEGSTNGDTSKLGINEMYVEGKGYDIAPSTTFWIGKRFLGRADVHIVDTFFINLAGVGAGFVVAGYFVVAVVAVTLLTFIAWGLFGATPSWAMGSWPACSPCPRPDQGHDARLSASACASPRCMAKSSLPTN